MSEAAAAVARTSEESKLMGKQQAAAQARNAQAEMLAKLKRDDARIMDELLDSDNAAEEEEHISMDTTPLDDYRVADRTCGLREFGLGKQNALRMNVFYVSQMPIFHNFILFVILYNILIMGLSTDEVSFQWKNPDFLFRNPGLRHQESWFPIEKWLILQ